MTLPARVLRANIDPYDTLSREFEGLLGRVFGGDYQGTSAGFPVDIWEDADQFHVAADLPGFTKDQVDVTLDNNVLTVTADRTATMEEKQDAGYLVRERRHIRLQRSFSLPNTIDESSVNAKLENGVLHVTLNKRAEAKPRKITVG